LREAGEAYVAVLAAGAEKLQCVANRERTDLDCGLAEAEGAGLLRENDELDVERLVEITAEVGDKLLKAALEQAVAVVEYEEHSLVSIGLEQHGGGSRAAANDLLELLENGQALAVFIDDGAKVAGLFLEVAAFVAIVNGGLYERGLAAARWPEELDDSDLR